jgi:hypothetical protein
LFDYFDRKLTREQNALITAYAETDNDANGTIDGITSTSSGKFFKLSKRKNFIKY